MTAYHVRRSWESCEGSSILSLCIKVRMSLRFSYACSYHAIPIQNFNLQNPTFSKSWKRRLPRQDPTMHSFISLSVLFATLSSIHTTTALPSPQPSSAASTTPLTPVYNLTQLTCSPAEVDTTPADSPPLNATACAHTLANFTKAYPPPLSSSATATSSPIVTFTTNASESHFNPASYVITPTEIVPNDEVNSAYGECGITFAVYYGSRSTAAQPDVPVSLAALTNATQTIINACTKNGKTVAGTGYGGSVVLTTPQGKLIDVTVFTPV